MKPKLGMLLAVVLCTSMAWASAAQAWDLILKTGNYTLSDDSQTIFDPFFGSFDLAFDDKSDSVFGIEGQWYWQPDTALGIEYLQFSNDWTSTAAGTSGDIDVSAFMFNFKKYFNTKHKVQPYIGAGIGFASLDFNGPGGTASGDDIAFQVVGGVHVRGKKAGFYSELKWFSSQPEDDAGEDIDVGGTGIFAGVSFHF